MVAARAPATGAAREPWSIMMLAGQGPGGGALEQAWAGCRIGAAA